MRDEVKLTFIKKGSPWTDRVPAISNGWPLVLTAARSLEAKPRDLGEKWYDNEYNQSEARAS